MAFTRRAPRRSESSSSSSSWQNELKNERYWQNELSFSNLKFALELVHNYDEWKSIKKSFRYKNIKCDDIIEWLRNQKGEFRKSYLHYLLISGYSRECNVCLFNVDIVPKDIEDIILCYTNLIFIKLYTNSNHHQTAPTFIRTFDCNLSINNLIAILNDNKDNNNNNLRLWTRFECIKFMYSVQKNGYHQKYTNTYLNDEDDGLKGDKERARWVQIPSDYGKDITLRDIDDGLLSSHQILEFGVDKINRSNTNTQKWTFKQDEDDNKDLYNHFEWIQSLKIGDNIDVNIGYQWPWMNAIIFGRDYDTFYIHIIDAKKFKINYPDFEIKSIGINNLQRLQQSNSRCKCNDKILTPSDVNVNNSNLVYCEWMTAFNTVSPFAHYPILFE